jgi:hypothetical protein
VMRVDHHIERPTSESRQSGQTRRGRVGKLGIDGRGKVSL